MDVLGQGRYPDIVKRFHANAVVAALLLSGCDPIYGVQTVAKLQAPVNTTCVDQAIRSVPEVGNVEFRQAQNENFGIVPNWGRVTTTTKYWTYTYGSNGAAILQIQESSKGSSLENGNVRMGVQIPDDQIETYLPLMRRINSSIEARCGIPLSSIGSLKRF